MHALMILPAFAVALVASSAQSDPAGRVLVEARPALVAIAPLPDELRLISLPTLQYELRIEPRCAAEMQAESIFVSVADTRTRLDAGDIDGQRRIEVELTLPRRQIAPIAIQEFCRVSNAGISANRVLRIEDVVTAHLSLRCSGQEHNSIVYASQALDVDLRCEVDPALLVPSGDQDASSASFPR